MGRTVDSELGNSVLGNLANSELNDLVNSNGNVDNVDDKMVNKLEDVEMNE